MHEALRSPGQSLDASARAFFEPRFGHDFSGVRVHTDAKAAASASAVEADAYTVGDQIVFAAGKWTGAAGSGLLAHELAHVAQPGQRGGAVGGEIEVSPPHSASERDADAAAHAAMTGRPVRLRERARPALFRQLPSAVTPRTGPGPEAPNSLASLTAGLTWLPPPFGPYLPRCGPDVTGWFVRTVNSAVKHPAVVAAKGLMEKAAEAAKPLGLTTDQLAEAGGTAAIELQEKRLGPQAPPRDEAISKQLTKGWRSVVDVTLAAPKMLSKEGAKQGASAAFHLGVAALLWKKMVDHGGPFDFKRGILNHPRSATGSCPDVGCAPGEVGTLTMCPSQAAGSCYEADLPGNLFYSVIGKHVGFSKTTLQLGSQLAELTDLPREGRPKVQWDTPDDTAAIELAYEWPVPLSRADICPAIVGARDNLAKRVDCRPCPESFQ